MLVNGLKRELFHIADDPRESKNLAEADPKQLLDMLAKLEEAARRDRDSVAR